MRASEIAFHLSVDFSPFGQGLGPMRRRSVEAAFAAIGRAIPSASSASEHQGARVNPNMHEIGAKTIKSLAWRLTLPIMFVGLLMTAFGISAAVYVHWEYRARSDYVALQVSGLNTLQDLIIAQRDLRYKLREFLLKGDVKEIDAAL